MGRCSAIQAAGRLAGENEERGRPLLTITVYGSPAPQGSKRHVGKGVMIEMSKKVKPWREAVKWAALEACDTSNPSQQGHGMGCVSGPVFVEMIFTMPRPKSAKKDAMADRRPDLDKLVRSTNDALSDVGTWEDDARVVRCVASKVFPGDVDSLASPGAIIRISSARETLKGLSR